MQKFIVLYLNDSLKSADAPLAFSCDAEDGDEAQEKCENAYPDCEVVWVFEGNDSQAAYSSYWGNDE
jgi:hypothetical protein